MTAKVLCAAAGAIALASGALALTLPDGEPAGLVERGETLLKAGDPAGAVAALKAAFAADPTASTRDTLGLALLSAGRPDEVLEIIPPTDYAAAPLRIEALVALRRFDDAALSAEAARSALGAGSDYYGARAAFGSGDVEAAHAHLAKALRGADAPAAFWILRAELALHANNIEEARAAQRRAQEAGSPAGDLLVLEIETLLREGKSAQAQQRLAASEKDAARDGRLGVLRAKVLAARGDYAAAARSLRAAHGGLAATPFNDLLAGLIHQALGETAQSERHFLRAARDAPRSAPAAEALGLHYLGVSRATDAHAAAAAAPAAARAHIAFAVAQKTGDGDAMLKAAHEAKGAASIGPWAFVLGPNAGPSRLEAARREATAELIAAAAIDPFRDARAARKAATSLMRRSDAVAATLAGQILIDIGDEPAARNAFDRALKADPDLAAAMSARLRVDLRAGDAASAVSRLQRRAEERKDAVSYYVLARALAAAGEIGQAAEILAGQAPPTDRDAAFRINVLKTAGQRTALDVAAATASVSREVGPETVRALLGAGAPESAAKAAQRVLAGAPADPVARAAYTAAMAAVGREREGDAVVRLLGPGLPAEEPADLAAARDAVVEDPSDPNRLRRFATALSEAGYLDHARCLRREAAFWGAQPDHAKDPCAP